MFKCGYIGVLGKPNVGKSTLVNELVGFKVSIITPKPQTTRYNIKGILTNEKMQAIFVDTPGIHKPKHTLGEYMMKGVNKALDESDLNVFLIDATKPRLDETNEKIIRDLCSQKKKTIFCINKVDKVQKERILKTISDYVDYAKKIGYEFLEVIPISVYKKIGIDSLLNCIEKYLPEGEIIYTDDELTDTTEREIAEEIIREKLLNNLDEEVPHGLNVEVETFEEKLTEKGEMKYNISANIICDKESHKPIVIGKNGDMLKKITSEARKSIEMNLDVKIKLKLWVKVRQNWLGNKTYLKKYENKLK